MVRKYFLRHYSNNKPASLEAILEFKGRNMVEGGREMLDRRVCIIGCVCVPLIGGGEATLTHPNERGVGV